MIVLIGGEKGGTGKTTIATNLAVQRARAGRDVLLVDTDTQRSAAAWLQIREDEGVEPKLSCIQLKGKGSVLSEVRKLMPRYDDVIIDAGGRDSFELRESMVLARVMVIPTQPSQFDIHSLATMDRMIAEAQTVNPTLSAFVLVNRAPAHPTMSDTDDAREFIAEMQNIQLTDTVVRDRAIFRRAAAQGMGVIEMPKQDEKATFEVRRLYKEVFETLKETA